MSWDAKKTCNGPLFASSFYLCILLGSHRMPCSAHSKKKEKEKEEKKRREKEGNININFSEKESEFPQKEFRVLVPLLTLTSLSLAPKRLVSPQ